MHLYGFLYQATVKHGWFSRAELNARIKAFPFLAKVRRPPPIPPTTLKGRKGKLPSGKGSIPYTSGQMLHFVLHSLEVLRPLMPVEAMQSPEWKAWVAHVQYFAAMMKPSFTDESIGLLDDMIYKAQTLFLGIKAYDQLWKPKNHFVQHIPSDIKRFGPPRTYWCMRFEAKNQEHKAAAKMGNWKNTIKTVATFWAERSAHRLQKKMRRKLPDIQPASDVDTAICYEGMDIDHGTWILFAKGPRPCMIGMVTGIRYSPSKGYLLEVTAHDADDILQNDGAGSECVVKDDLALNFGKKYILRLEQTAITILLPVEQQGKIWFVEQP